MNPESSAGSWKICNNANNEAGRAEWVKDQIFRISQDQERLTLIDCGAGQSPFREHITSCKINYRSHDFNAYKPSKETPGIQNETWDYPHHDFICEILEIPEIAASNIVLCTEVLEHVPDPVAVLRKLIALCMDDGWIIITVPFMSLMHQSPYWFSSGLSPYWFLYWSKNFGCEIENVQVSGDYADYLNQEIGRVFYSNRILRRIGRYINFTRFIRFLIPQNLAESGGFSTFVVLRKPGTATDQRNSPNSTGGMS